MKKILVLLSIITLLFQFCQKSKPVDFSVTAKCETQKVAAGIDEDAADDPAIWINCADRSKSVIYGSNKIDNGGVYAYDLSGKELGYYQIGSINNVDVRYGLSNGKDTIDILGGSNRTENSLSFFKIDSVGSLTRIGDLKSKVDEVYGFCLGHDKQNEKFYAFVVSTSGMLEQWEIILSEDCKIEGKIVRETKVDTKSEGLVVDDETNTLYLGEEENCIWKYSIDPTTGDKREKLPMSGAENKRIAFDWEGLAIYYMSDGEGYLIASSQGNFTYAVFDRKTDEFITSFDIVDGSVDGSQETDGIDVLNISLPEYEGGIFVVQDGFNYDNDTKISQNFKYISWQDIVNLSDGKLKLNGKYTNWK